MAAGGASNTGSRGRRSGFLLAYTPRSVSRRRAIDWTRCVENLLPDYCANAHPPCSNPYFLRLWYSLPFTSVVGGHVLIVDLDEQQRVIEKGEMSSP